MVMEIALQDLGEAIHVSVSEVAGIEPRGKIREATVSDKRRLTSSDLLRLPTSCDSRLVATPD